MEVLGYIAIGIIALIMILVICAALFIDHDKFD